MRIKRRQFPIAVLLGVFVSSASIAESGPSFRVTDENGNPLANVAGGQLIDVERVHQPDYRFTRSIEPSGTNGIVTLMGPDDIRGPGDPIGPTDALHYDLWLMGDTHGARFELAQGQQVPETVSLQPLVNVQIRVAGPVMPDFVPVVVPIEKTVDAIIGKSFYSNPTPSETHENTWYVALIEDEVYIAGWNDKNPPKLPDKMPHEQPESRMLGCLSDAFVATEGKTVEMEPGLPASVVYDLSEPPPGMDLFPVRVRFGRIYLDGNTETFSPGMNSFVVEEPQVVRFDGIAQGRWMLSVNPWGGNDFGPAPVMFDEREVRMESGQDLNLTPEYPTFDNTVDEGDLTIRGVVVNGSGEIVPNHQVWIWPWSKDPGRRYGAFRSPTTTDAEGRFVLDGLSPENTYHVNTVGSDGRMANAAIGDAAYDANGIAETRLVVNNGANRWRPLEGQTFDGITVEWSDGETSGLNSFKGKTVLIDVWATWCKPCIAAFPDYDALAKRHASDDSLVFLALNVDSGVETWKTFLSQNGFPNVRHGWIDELTNPVRFGALPHKVIVDGSGQIAAIGTDIDFEDWLDQH